MEEKLNLKAKHYYSLLIYNFNQYRLIFGRLIFAKLINRRIRKNQIKCVHLGWQLTWRNEKTSPAFGAFMLVLLFGRFLREIGINLCIEFSQRNIYDKVLYDYQDELNLLIQKYFPTCARIHSPREGCVNLSQEVARLRLFSNSDRIPDHYLPSIIHNYSREFNYSNIRISRQELRKNLSFSQESLKIIWGHRLDSIQPFRNSGTLNHFLLLHSLLKISNRIEIVNIGSPEAIIRLRTKFQKHAENCTLCENSRISFEINPYVTNTERILSGSLYLSDSRNGLTDFALMSDVPSVLVSFKWRYHPNRSGQSYFWKTEHQYWLDSTNISDYILISRLEELVRSILLGEK